MILDKETFTRNHEVLFHSHNTTSKPECRCILCDIYRKHLKKIEKDENQLYLPFN